MKYRKIVLAGGNGYLGSVLAAYYKDLAEEVIILSRKKKADDGTVKKVLWDGMSRGEWTRSLENADLLINLCGKNVNCRYTPENRKTIIASRVIPTRLLGEVLNELKAPPGLWINITSATIYRHAEDHAQDEATGEEGYGFSIDVCRQWEQAFFHTQNPSTRKVALRLGISLGRKDGVFPRLMNLVKFGLGGSHGDGQQYISWIHEHDVARCTEWLIQQKEMDGIVNCNAPGAIKNADLMRIMRKAYGMPIGLPAPQWLLEIGTRLIGTEMELVMKSRWVSPKRLIDGGFRFQFNTAEHAVHDLLALRV